MFTFIFHPTHSLFLLLHMENSISQAESISQKVSLFLQTKMFTVSLATNYLLLTFLFQFVCQGNNITYIIICKHSHLHSTYFWYYQRILYAFLNSLNNQVEILILLPNIESLNSPLIFHTCFISIIYHIHHTHLSNSSCIKCSLIYINVL